MNTTTNEEIYTLDRYLELKKEGFEFDGESFLFWEYMRILGEVREVADNPDLVQVGVQRLAGLPNARQRMDGGGNQALLLVLAEGMDSKGERIIFFFEFIKLNLHNFIKNLLTFYKNKCIFIPETKRKEVRP